MNKDHLSTAKNFGDRVAVGDCGVKSLKLVPNHLLVASLMIKAFLGLLWL